MTSGDNRWVASVPVSSGTSFAGRLALLGGTLALADEEVTFTPLAGLGRVRRVAMVDIEGVTAHADRPPRLCITTRTGRRMVFMVLPRRTTMVWSSDPSARDEAVDRINARLAR
ncbi:hypothetical protein AB0J51_13990 [Micromonospora echinofusca]|uniref:hypothetical protein n=1 Tax=Micromonospora echinofusca TaxID=47858 RepID=UPI000B5AC39C|nr:hypothetical protein [Micromonospora echinofusca]